jgi:peptidoglycan/xylan/chitin deacetylase (PgdA/CDA1 family)
MRGYRGVTRAFILPQGIIALTALILVISAFNPGIRMPRLNGGGLLAFVTPARITPVGNHGSAFSTSIPAHTIGRSSERVASRMSPAPVLKSYRPHIDCDSRPCIVLSFDDGPNAQTTPKILDVLEQAHINATFFVVGVHVGGNEALIRRMAAEGFEIGNHTWDHQDLTKLPPDQIEDELVRTQTAIAATGAAVPTLFRPPYGSIDPTISTKIGLQTALWNIDPRDWQATDPGLLQQSIVAMARPGGIIDLHDTHQVTAEALTGAIQQLKQQGYQFVTVSDLLYSRDRSGHAPFYGYAGQARP